VSGAFFYRGRRIALCFLGRMNGLGAIRNFFQVDEHLATSGMPRPDDFSAMAEAGYNVVINLAMPTSDHALANEGDLVTRAGMSYVHLPVNFESPRAMDFERFVSVMETWRGQRVFVHCAANMRVSAFVFLYRVLHCAVPRAAAEEDLKRIWNPDGAWRALINDQLKAAGHAPLF
jgi:protein tyrosine phosphatase (PTP) superfamily phosphohydrolase (DUF442 family)